MIERIIIVSVIDIFMYAVCNSHQEKIASYIFLVFRASGNVSAS